MPDYRWGIFLAPASRRRRSAAATTRASRPGSEVPGEHRNALRRIIVTQADTEPASVEQQRLLGHTAPSLYDMRNLFQVNVEEGRHLWAMVYLLHKYFGRDGRDEADELLERRSGDPDKPRILGAFNQPCDHWLSSSRSRCSPTATASISSPRSRSRASTRCRARPSSCSRRRRTTCSSARPASTASSSAPPSSSASGPNGDVRNQGGVDFDLIQKTINYWFTYSLDLFGGEISSSNAADYFASGMKGRFREEACPRPTRALDQS
jgi:benzoyl-CoA 2,3-dioxygenase component B